MKTLSSTIGPSNAPGAVEKRGPDTTGECAASRVTDGASVNELHAEVINSNAAAVRQAHCLKNVSIVCLPSECCCACAAERLLSPTARSHCYAKQRAQTGHGSHRI